MFRVANRMLSLSVALVATSHIASAQTSYPMLMSLKPVAVQVGTTAECAVNSRYTMAGAYQVIVSGTGVTGEAILPPEKPADPMKKEDEKKDDAAKKADPPKKPDITKLQIKFTVSPDAELGVRDFRVATPQGVSTIGQLVVVRDPVVAESASNDTLDKAQMVSLPATLCGAIEKAEDVDLFKFHVDAGTRLTFHVRSGRLQDRIHDLQTHSDPIIRVRTAAGVTLASNDNFFFADPLISYKFEHAGDYVLEIRDVRYEGNAYWEYCIEVNHRPFVQNVFPLAISRGQTVPVRMVGYQLPETPMATCTAPMDAPMGDRWVSLEAGSQPTNPVPMLITDLPLVTETDADNNDIATAQLIAIPAGVNGRMEREGDIDCFMFEAKKGEFYSFEIVARRRQSGLDSYLRILNDKGAQLSVNDDLRRGKKGWSDSLIENFEVKADGKYFIEIRDVHARGGEQFPYFLKVTKAEPNFELFLDTDKTQVVPGSCAMLFCRVERKNGFTGPVQLQIDGLPAGVTATCGRILPEKSVDGVIVLEAAKDASLVASQITVTGTATHTMKDGEERTLTAVAQPNQETYMPGGGRGHYPVDSHTVAVNPSGDILEVTLSDYEISLKPGESKKIEVTITRAPEFKTNVTLDMVYQHLASNFANCLPPGVTLDDKQAKTLLAGSATQGFLTLKAAKDAAPVEKQLGCVMAHVSLNFVMKATYCSKPVFITVAAP